MSGHSKWHSIKHKKAAIDAKRGKIFNKIIREITTAARIGGGDIESNPRLRLSVQKAKEVNMPADNIERAIKKGTGELEGVNFEEHIYEGYGPSGTAIMVASITDNKNRTTSELRTIFSKNNGNLGENGCVSWMFTKKGIILVKKDNISEDELFTLIADAGAEDMKENDDGSFEITTDPDNFEKVKEKLEEKNIEIESSDITMIPQNYVKVNDEKAAKQIARLLMALDENEDVQHVYTNADIPEEAFEGL